MVFFFFTAISWISWAQSILYCIWASYSHFNAPQNLCRIGWFQNKIMFYAWHSLFLTRRSWTVNDEMDGVYFVNFKTRLNFLQILNSELNEKLLRFEILADLFVLINCGGIAKRALSPLLLEWNFFKSLSKLVVILICVVLKCLF